MFYEMMNPENQARVLQDFFEGAGYSATALKASWHNGVHTYWFRIWPPSGEERAPRKGAGLEPDAVVEVRKDRVLLASRSSQRLKRVRALLSKLGYHAGISYTNALGSHIFETSWGG
jgi:hypothetical protein